MQYLKEKCVRKITLASNGTFQVKLGKFCLDECYSQIIVDDSPARLHWQELRPGLWTANNLLEEWQILWNEPNDQITAEFSGTCSNKFSKVEIQMLVVPQVAASHVLSQGIAMGSCKSVVLPVAGTVTMASYYQTMITRRGGTLQIAFPLQQKHPMVTTLNATGAGVEKMVIGATLVNYGKNAVKLDKLSLKCSNEPFKLMSRWADEQVEAKRDFAELIKPGWNSWDYYRWTITEEEVLENAEFIARDPVLSKHIKRIIIDDGWQYCYGEWDANSLFPSGMEYLAKQLTKMGFEPGLWLAPAIFEPQSRIAQLDGEMLAKAENGLPCIAFECMRRYGFVIDPTTAKARKFLYNLFDRYAKMGYRYFKLDFLGQTLNARKFADGSAGRGEIVRKIVEPITQAVKGRAVIMGCNYPYMSGADLVDTVRVGGDIHATWSGIKENVSSVSSRFWANKKLWINDPDFALCRSFDTANDPDLLRLHCRWVSNTPEKKQVTFEDDALVSEVNRPQIELLLSIVIMNGGAVNLSDKLTRLNDSGLDLARRAVSAVSLESAIPLDLFESERPSYWLQKSNKLTRVLLVNWDDTKELERALDLAEHKVMGRKVKNFWNDEPIKLEKESILRIIIPPRSCILAEISQQE